MPRANRRAGSRGGEALRPAGGVHNANGKDGSDAETSRISIWTYDDC